MWCLPYSEHIKHDFKFFTTQHRCFISGQLPESVKALLKRAHINRYPKRTTIVDAGTESKSLYLILKGSVSIILREDDEREIVVAYLNPGDFFGEMGLFEPNPQRTAEVRTRDVCEIAEISYDNFHELSKQYPDLSYAVFAQLVRRLKIQLVK